MPPDAAAARIAVAIATMNRPEGLIRCVAAVLGGSMRPGELVIVDQSDGDDTERRIAGSDWRSLVPLAYVRQPRLGLAASRNAAIRTASRPVIAFTDDDCVPDAEWLGAIAAALHGPTRPDAVTGRVLPLGPERPGFFAVSTRASERRREYRGRALPWSVGSGGNAAVTRDWLDRIGGFDERLGAGTPGRSAEDIDLFYRLLRAGATVRYEPRATVFHERQSGERRLASRPSYGFGLGAFCAFCARQHDAYALWMLGRWSTDRAVELARACVRRRWRRVREELLMLQGARDGLVYGLTKGAIR